MEENNKIGSDLFEIVLSVQKVSEFTKWIYSQISLEVENLIGEDNYLELISADYKGFSISQLKQFIKSNLPERLINEFEQELINRNSKIIKGKCIKQHALNYDGNEIRNWQIVEGESYEFLKIISGIKKGNHTMLVNYVDKTNDFLPSGFVPAELFQINLDSISELYCVTTDAFGEGTIEIEAFSNGKYVPERYSFWEDFYDDEPKAVKMYFDELRKMGIVDLWE